MARQLICPEPRDLQFRSLEPRHFPRREIVDRSTVSSSFSFLTAQLSHQESYRQGPSHGPHEQKDHREISSDPSFSWEQRKWHREKEPEARESYRSSRRSPFHYEGQMFRLSGGLAGRPSWRLDLGAILLASAIFFCSSLVNNEIRRLTVFAAAR